jgi:transcriptional regulator with XRE-family HTH domain
LITDAQQTKILRSSRVMEAKAVKDLNPIGKRIEWVRRKLELSQRQVCDATKIPASSYCGREAGVRAILAEEYLVLAVTFDRLWRQRFKDAYPSYEGEEIKRISIQWLLFGYDDVSSNAEAIIQEYQVRIKEMEEEFFNKEAELLRQLDMFAKEA